MTETPYNTARLLTDLNNSMPGIYRRAEILLTVHPDDRAEVVRRANRYVNATAGAGRPSDALRSCAADADIRRVPAPA